MNYFELEKLVKAANKANDTASTLFKEGHPDAWRAGIQACALFDELTAEVTHTPLKQLARAFR